jgi:glutathione S-transferase
MEQSCGSTASRPWGTAVDGYLFTVLGWPQYVGIDLAKWPAIKGYVDKIAKRPSVQAALKAEGLVK